MRYPSLIAAGLGLGLIVASAQTTPKTPRFIECIPEAVILHPATTQVTWKELQSPGNALDQFLNEVEAQRAHQYVVVFARPAAVKTYRAVRKLLGLRQIDVAYEPLEDKQPLEVHNSGVKLGQRLHNKVPVYFECRNHQVFFVDKDGLEAQVQEVFAHLNPDDRRDPQGIARRLAQQEIGNELYRLNAAYLMAAIMALEPKPNATGDTPEKLQNQNSPYRHALSRFGQEKHYIVFLLRDDSIAVFREARAIAENDQFEVGWELLGKDEPIKFGAGGSMTP